MFWKNKIVFVLVLFVSIFWYVVFSDAVNTSYTEFYFVSGGNNYTTLSVNLTWWETGHASFYLENKSSADIDMNISFVDGMYTTDGSNIRVCKSENEKDMFGNYVDIDDDTFTLLAGSGVTESLNLLFPSWYSWLYHGCVVYYPDVTEWSTHLNTVARKAIFLDVEVVPTSSNFTIKAYPSARFANERWHEWKVLFYANWVRDVVLYSGYITSNIYGSWDFVYDVPSWLYDIVYRWSSHLWSYLSWVIITWWQVMLLDFTTGANLTGTIIYNLDNTQIAWDVVRDGKINVIDITAIANVGCDYWLSSATQYHRCNLNWDWWVNIWDVTVAANNVGRTGPYFGWSAAVFEWFNR